MIWRATSARKLPPWQSPSPTWSRCPRNARLIMVIVMIMFTPKGFWLPDTPVARYFCIADGSPNNQHRPYLTIVLHIMASSSLARSRAIAVLFPLPQNVHGSVFVREYASVAIVAADSNVNRIPFAIFWIALGSFVFARCGGYNKAPDFTRACHGIVQSTLLLSFFCSTGGYTSADVCPTDTSQ